MYQWFNPSHPQTLKAAIILGYLSAVFEALGSGVRSYGALILMLSIGLGAGAFGSANNKKWGYLALAGCATGLAAFDLFDLQRALYQLAFQSGPWLKQLKVLVQSLNRTVFPIALAAAALHSESRRYQKAWFK